MSFRRRGEVVNGRTPPGSRPVGGAVPGNNPMLRRPAGTGVNRGIPQSRTDQMRPELSQKTAGEFQKSTEKPEIKHPGVKPSIVLSNINCVSTGTTDIDTTLVHGGLPVNCSLLVEEDGSTDFSGVLLKNYVSEGIVQNRKTGKLVNHCIVVGMDSSFGNELPDIYAGNSKERKKKFVREQEGKLSVSNVNAGNELKIAWRYRKDITASNSSELISPIDDSKYPEYNHQFDITTTIRPSPSAAEISYIRLSEDYQTVLTDIKKVVDRELKDPFKMIRVAVPYMLNPMVYGCENLTECASVIKFVFGLRQILNAHTGRITLMASMSSELFEDTPVLESMENVLFDGVIRLVPFTHELNALMERVYKTQREKIKQGYVNVLRVPVLSSIGLMERRIMEYSFKNSKSRFHVEQWSIPVEEEDIDDSKKADF